MKTPPQDQQKKRVGIWIRVSTDDQARGESPAHHEQRAREYAKFNGWEVAEVYDLAGVSGKTVMEHPEAKRMLADLKRGHITTLIFSKLARLARNTKELLDFSDKFRAAGADMVSLQEKIDTSTPAGRLFYTMIAAMAQWEREEIADRVKASISIRAKLGKPLGGSSPYGFHWVDKKLVQKPSEAMVVKQAFELFLQHRRKGVVSRLLNEAGYRTRENCKWRDMQIARMLTQSAAKGVYVYNLTRKIGEWQYEDKPESEWSTIAVEPIISEDTWHQVSVILEAQSKDFAKPAKRPVRLFGSLTKCHCGQNMYVPTGSRKYTCKKCRNSIPEEDLEAIFYEELKGYFSAPERLAHHLEEAQKTVLDKQQRLIAHRKEIQNVRDQMNRTHQLYLDGQIALKDFGSYHKPLEERLRQLQDELPKLEAELTHMQIHEASADEIMREARGLYEQWPTLPLPEKLKVVESIAERVTIGKEEITIQFSYLPSSEELTNSQQALHGVCGLLFSKPGPRRVVGSAR